MGTFSRSDEEAFYWVGQFCKHGMTLSQAERLAFEVPCDRHQILAALEQGCSSDLAYLIWS